MTVEHIVWIKFKPGIGPDRIAEHLAALASLPDRVPTIVNLRLGENFTDRANGYTHGLIVTFANRASLETYATHPQHVPIADALKQDADLLAMDFECSREPD